MAQYSFKVLDTKGLMKDAKISALIYVVLELKHLLMAPK